MKKENRVFMCGGCCMPQVMCLCRMMHPDEFKCKFKNCQEKLAHSHIMTEDEYKNYTPECNQCDAKLSIDVIKSNIEKGINFSEWLCWPCEVECDPE